MRAKHAADRFKTDKQIIEAFLSLLRRASRAEGFYLKVGKPCPTCQPRNVRELPSNSMRDVNAAVSKAVNVGAKSVAAALLISTVI